MNTCRLCKGIGEPLFKYGVRHYIHADCGFRKWGEGFLDKLYSWQIGQLPYRVLQEFGMLEVARKKRNGKSILFKV